MADLKATPRSSVLGAIADVLTRARSVGDKAKIPFTDMGLGELFLGKMPEEVNEWSYGNAPLQVVGRGTGSRVPQTKLGRQQQLADTVFGLQGMAPLTAASARAVKAIPSAVRHGAEEFAHASAAANPRVVKQRGGNWLRGGGLEYLDELSRQNDPEEIKNWVRGPLNNYIMRDLGAETDPLLKLADEGISPLTQGALLNPEDWMRSYATRNRKLSGMKQPDLGGYAQGWSDRADAMLDLTTVGKARENLGPYWPNTVEREGAWLDRAPDEAKLYGFAGDEAPYHLGFDNTVEALRRGLADETLPPHLQLTPERLRQMGIEKAVRYQDALDTFVKQRDDAELLAAGKVPAYDGTRVKDFDNGFYITDLTKPTELTDDMRGLVRENPDGTWTALSPSGKPMQRRVVPGEDAPLVDVVESTPEDAILGAALGHEGRVMNHCVGGYCYDVSKGQTKVYSLRDAEGKPHVTVEVEQPADLELTRRASELQAKYANYVATHNWDAMDFPDWLEIEAPDMLKYGPEIFESGATKPIVRQVYGAANSEPKPEYRALLGKYLQEAGLTGDEPAMRNAGLYPLRDKWVTQDELSNLIKPSTEGAAPDYDAVEAWQQHIIDNGDIRFAEGGLIEGDDDFAYPGMF